VGCDARLLAGVCGTALERGGTPPVEARRAFWTVPVCAEFPGLVDLAAILPLWLSVFVASDFRILLVLRLVRFFKLTRYSLAMRSLLEALYSERRALTGCFVILLGTALIAAALMHLAERTAQPERFGTIPDALWWAIVTLGTNRIRRCRSRYSAWADFGGLHHLRRAADDGAAGRHFCYAP
jgi:hypothetical protein